MDWIGSLLVDLAKPTRGRSGRCLVSPRQVRSDRPHRLAGPRYACLMWFLLCLPSIGQADDRAACAILPAEIVSKILAHSVRAKSSAERTAESGTSTCRYVDARYAVELHVYHNDSERSAVQRFAQAVDRFSQGDADPLLLRGIGNDARFLVTDHGQQGTIAARFDTSVLLLSGPPDQVTLVALMRSAIAELAGRPHERHP